MKLLENKLYLTINDCVECGMNYRTITDAKDKGTKCWDLIDDPQDKRRVLVGFDALNDERRRMVEVRFGNPYDYVARTPILEMVVSDWKANEYFRSFGGAQNDRPILPPERVNQYTRAEAWLRMLAGVKERKTEIKKNLGLILTEFYIHVSELISVEKERGKIKGYAGLDVLPGDFPSSYQRLVAKVGTYEALRKAEGDKGAWDSLIDPLYGNKNAAKIGRSSFGEAQDDNVMQGLLPEKGGVSDVVLTVSGGDNDQKSLSKRGAFALFSDDLYEQQMAVIRRVCAMPNNFDAGQVTEMVNLVFSANGWKTLSRATIHDIITENKHLLTAGRQGKRKYMSDVAMQNKRKAPDYPLYYWTLDGWTVEMMYQERSLNTQGDSKIDYKRLVMVVVLDAFNKYPIGYAIGERETPELIREACRNAILHTQELLGQPYRPLQLQSDNYQIKKLTPFYSAIPGLYYTPAQVGNSKAKVIEPYFKHLNKKHAQKTRFWTGFNVDAVKKNQVNKEYLDKIKKDAPDKAGLIRQIEGIIAKERKAKIEGFMTGFANVPIAEKDMCLMTELDWLMVFGLELGKRTNKITGQGIIKVINGVEYTYDSFDPAFRANMHLDWMLYGEPDHLMKVLAVSPDRKMKFVLEEKRVLPMDLHSTTQADVDYRMRVKNFNQERMAEITAQYGSDADIAREVVLNTPLNLNDEDEMALKLMLTVGGEQKERLQNAKGLAKGRKMLEAAIVKEERMEANSWQEKRMQHITQDIDLDQYAQ